MKPCISGEILFVACFPKESMVFRVYQAGPCYLKAESGRDFKTLLGIETAIWVFDVGMLRIVRIVAMMGDGEL